LTFYSKIHWTNVVEHFLWEEGLEGMDELFDILIIGSGVIGSAVARELSRYQLKIGVLEKELDVCNETSGRNSGVIHGGFNYKTGSLKAQCCVEGCLEFQETADELDVPFKRCGKVLVGFTEEDLISLEKSKELGDRNGSKGLEVIGEERLKELAPYINGKYAMFSPYSGIVNPFLYTIALAENARMNGAEFFFKNEVTAIDRQAHYFEITTAERTFRTRWVVNCAGLNSAVISEMLGIPGYTMRGFKGEYYVLDQKAGNFLSLPAYPVSNPKIGMGIHATPTVDGNVIIGPNSDLVNDLSDYSVSSSGMADLIESGSKLFPHIKAEYIIRNFAGVRP
jgi:glycerol-3-phosphate dehydrogenase